MDMGRQEDHLKDEELWFERVEELLSEKGLSTNTDDDGWMFWFENGNTPEQAITMMLS